MLVLEYYLHTRKNCCIVPKQAIVIACAQTFALLGRAGTSDGNITNCKTAAIVIPIPK